MTQAKVVACIASYPARSKTLEQVILAVCPQVDAFYVYLNGYTAVPNFFTKIPNAVPILDRDSHGDISAAGKMAFLQYEKSGYAFTLDDDIIYPPNYVAKLIELHRQLGGGIGICVHGSVVPDAASWYYERSTFYDSETTLNQAEPVNLVGSGTFSYRIEEIDLRFEDFLGPVQVDLCISRAFLAHGLPLAACPREAGWLRFLNYAGMTCKLKQGITHHTLAIRDCPEMKLDHVQSIWSDYVRIRPALARSNAIGELLQAGSLPRKCRETKMPATWGATSLYLAKNLEFAGFWSS